MSGTVDDNFAFQIKRFNFTLNRQTDRQICELPFAIVAEYVHGRNYWRITFEADIADFIFFQLKLQKSFNLKIK